jgi:hypothetical protein
LSKIKEEVRSSVNILVELRTMRGSRHNDGEKPMKKLFIATTMLFTALPFTFDGVTPTVSKAHAIIGRPLTPFSVAGVHRRAVRRTYGIGANLGYSGYYHRNFGPYAYNRLGYGTGYYPSYGYGYGTGYRYPSYGYGFGTGYSYPSYGYGYGTGYSYPSYGYGYGRGIVRRGVYAAAWRNWR